MTVKQLCNWLLVIGYAALAIVIAAMWVMTG